MGKRKVSTLVLGQALELSSKMQEGRKYQIPFLFAGSVFWELDPVGKQALLPPREIGHVPDQLCGHFLITKLICGYGRKFEGHNGKERMIKCNQKSPICHPTP